MRRAHARACISIAILLACCACSFALDGSFQVIQYAHSSWTAREGLMGSVRAIVQTPDGYLWLGTEFGLVRFDGVRFLRLLSDQQLPSPRILSLLAARDGTLWIGTYRGLASWKDGRLTRYPEIPDQVSSLLEDYQGTIWLGGKERVCAIRHERIDCRDDLTSGVNFRYAYLQGNVFSLHEDSEHRLWAGAESGLWQWQPGPPRRVLTRPIVTFGAVVQGDQPNALTLITDSPDGRVLRQIADNKEETYSLPGPQLPFTPNRLMRDRNGGLWIGTLDQGLLHVHDGKTTRFAQSDGLSSDIVLALFEDREGNAWVGTTNGLDRFHASVVSTISASEGLSTPAWSVAAAHDGSIWIGTDKGVNRWQDGQLTVYRSAHLPGVGDRAATQGAVREITDPGLPDNLIGPLSEDKHGRLWVMSRSGAAWFENGRFTRAGSLTAGSTTAIAADTREGVWIADPDSGLVHMVDGREIESVSWPWSKAEHDRRVSAILLDPVRGGLWLGFLSGGIAYFEHGKLATSLGSKDGLGADLVWNLFLDRSGALWAATDGGLSRVKNGRVATLTTKNGLPCDVVRMVLEDDASSLWLYTACGLVRIAHSELDAWWSDSKRTVQTTVFDSSDGVRSSAIVGRYGSRAAKSLDGKLWFAHGDGVSVIDPRHLAFNTLLPPVRVETVTADRQTYDASQRLILPPLVRDLSIDYTALSLVASEKNRFRVKLEGWDSDWRDVGNRRQAFYTNLPPRHYHFRVIACNNSGVWNEEGATLEFVIPPAWYQTNWFRALCVAAFLAVLYALYRVRIGQLRAQEQKFREAIESIPAIAFVCRPDGYRSFVNKGWVEYTGLTTEQSSGSRWQAAIHAEDLDRVIARWRASLASGDPLEYETRLRRADGEYRWFMTRAVPLRDKHGKIVKWYGTATDIEDRKRAEQLQADFAHMNRVTTMGELTASLAHEIKQPITATVLSADACLQWLNHDQPDLDEVRDAAKMIVAEGKRAAEIIERLRGLYKKSPPKRELVNINKIVQEMIVMLRGEANRFGVSIRTDLATELPKITADRVQLQQVLMNLMLNAIEAMKETGGVLMIKSRLGNGHHVLIAMRDTGVGLPTENVDQIFSAFFTTKPEGSGMGLAITRSILESHGGRIWATPNDGRGATFHFTMPTAGPGSES